MDPREWIHRHSSGFVTAMARLSTCISLMLSQIFNLALVARLIGWRVSIPIAITFVYSVACKTIDWAISESLHDSKPQPQPGARLRFTTLVENIRAIKENGWESAFRPLANASTDANGQETRRTRAFYRIAAYLISLVGTSASQIASAVVVISHFQLSNDLSYIDVLLLVPAIESLTGSLSLVTRILDDVELVYQNSSLLYTLLRKDAYQRVQRLPETPDAGSSLVSLENCTFAWSPEDTHAGRERPVLSDVTLSVGQGEIVAVVGSLACGKSSLLSAICGLLPLTAGNGQVRGEIGLVEEHVWLAEDTFRANITLGHEFDEFRYWHAVETCSLSKVTQSWPLGDMEIVAGSQCRVEMSTGQRILLQLARTLYAQPDLVLIDDVFSVIDVQSRNAFLALWFADGNGQTSAPAMVMVTRSKRLASLADQLVHVSNGKVHVSRQKPVKWESLVLTSGSSSSSGTRLNGSPDAPESPGAESVLSDRTMLEGLSFYTQDRQQHQCKDGSGSSSPATPSASLPCWGSYLGRYMAISGYSWMLYTLGTQALSIYAAYQVDGYRMDLVIGGDKTVTMMQSLQSYLVVDALVGIAQQQLGNAERWIHQNAWAKRAKLAMQSEIVSSLIDTPASLVGSGTSRAELYQMLNADRDLLAVEIPRLLSQRILLLLRSCHSMAQVLRMSPRTVFVVAPLLMVYGIAVWWWRRRTSWAVSETANDPSYLRAAELRESILRGDRALRTMHSQARGHCKTKLGSLSALASHRLSVHYCIGFVEGVIGDICIESLPVIAALTLLAQRCLANEGVSPSDVDMAIRLTEVASLRLHSAFCIRDHSAAILAQALRRYFAFVSRSDKPAKPTSVSKEGLPNSDGGGIVMECKAFGIRYKQCTDPLLSNVSFTLRSGERLAIVGYDGTGKTALVRGILGLCPPCPSMVETLGAVHIYSALGAPATRDLHALVSIVHGDDPVLLEGTLRFSLDPLGQCADAEISSMVERTGLHELLGKHVELDSPTGALSTCQRKLVCLCRAILANRPVVVLDRLSAGMDTATQRKVHAVVRQELKKRVVLDITNQPGEISTSDGVLVVQDGRAEIVSLCPKEGV
ncbi:P-loop containing nucleoside triphosphate hydrolase protein [Martensiomyces pterosporus]|nr:P-loop containing nucleoside triphosphate hydrolase protein [Martensiomyces pterosporus]